MKYHIQQLIHPSMRVIILYVSIFLFGLSIFEIHDLINEVSNFSFFMFKGMDTTGVQWIYMLSSKAAYLMVTSFIIFSSLGLIVSEEDGTVEKSCKLILRCCLLYIATMMVLSIIYLSPKEAISPIFIVIEVIILYIGFALLEHAVDYLTGEYVWHEFLGIYGSLLFYYTFFITIPARLYVDAKLNILHINPAFFIGVFLFIALYISYKNRLTIKSE